MTKLLSPSSLLAILVVASASSIVKTYQMVRYPHLEERTSDSPIIIWPIVSLNQSLQVDTTKTRQNQLQIQTNQTTQIVEETRTNQTTTQRTGSSLTDVRPTTITSIETKQRLTNQERSQSQMETRNELKHFSKKNQQDATEKPDGPSSMPLPATIPHDMRRTRRSAGQQQQQLPVVHTLLGQQLSIPCSNLSASLPASMARQSFARAPNARAGQSASDMQASKRAPSTGGISLIVWHKDDQLNEPIFVADARGVVSMRDTKQQTLAEHLRGRTRLDVATSNGLPGLQIDEATMQEAGAYTCTVEFHKAPTQTFQVRVIVVDPPKNMLIRDNNLDAAERPASMGHDEDSRLELVCEVEAGVPAVGFVSWWQLESVMQMPGESGQQQQQVRKAPGWPFALLDKVNYISTLSEPVDGLQSGSNLLVGAHSTAPNELAAPVGLDPSMARGRRLLKHWRRFNSSNTNAAEGDTKLKASIEIGQVRRQHSETEFMCLANNNNFSAPLNTTIRLNVNLKPTEVRIANKANLTFRLDQRTVIECQVSGSKPSALIKWVRGGEELELAQQQQQLQSAISDAKQAHDHHRQQSEPTRQPPASSSSYISEFNRDTSNMTKISYLTIIPKLSDNQQTLTCLGSNPRMVSGASTTLSDTITMNVQCRCPGACKLQFGTNIRPDSIKLGSDIFMDCNIDANPPIDDNDLTWLLNDRPLLANSSAGIIMSNRSLVLQRIRVESRGSYQCLARNSVGKAASNRLELRPKFEPICDYNLTKTRYEIPLNQATRIECNVLAEPSEDLYFTWRFKQTNNTNGASLLDDSTSQDVDEMLRQYETNFAKSSVIFTPKFRRHYGQLLCMASNSMGKQERPCVIQVVASELPEPVVSCFIDNQTQSSFSVHCQPPATSVVSSGPLGGLKQVQYLLEVFSSSSNESNGPALLASTHLKSRQPSDSEDLAIPDHEDDDDGEGQNDEHQGDDNFSGDQRDNQSRQSRIKRLLSDSPTFNVVDLRPNSTYNVQVYVQNSKGRSSAYHQQANTRPLTDLATAAGKVELINRRPSAGLKADGLSNRLMSYLKFDEYFGAGGDSAAFKLNGSDKTGKPMVGVALVVLLTAITLVTVVFFINRLCRSASRGAAGCKRRPSNSSANNTKLDCRDDSQNELASNNSRLSSARTMTRTNNSSSGQVGGSGSDTSRETNTDSTLVSSPNQRVAMAPTMTTGTSCANKHQYHQQMAARFGTTSSYCGARRYSQNQSQLERNSISGSLTRAAAAGLRDGHPMLMMKDTLGMPAYRYSANEDHLRHSAQTPQQSLSIQSGSDCTSIQPDGPLSEHQMVVEQQQRNEGDQIYVMNRNNDQQVRLVSPDGYWSAAPGSDIIQQAQAVASLGRCRIVEGHHHQATGSPLDNAGQQFLNAATLPSSMSIPVSLSDRLQVLARGDHLAQGEMVVPTAAMQRYSSQDYLLQQQQQQSNRTGSYLTLAPSTEIAPNEQHYCYHHHHHLQGVPFQELQVAPAPLAPPSDFANDYRRFKDTLGIANNQESYCSGTTGADDGSSTATTTTTTTTNTFDELNRAMKLPHGQKHRVKFDTTN